MKEAENGSLGAVSITVKKTHWNGIKEQEAEDLLPLNHED